MIPTFQLGRAGLRPKAATPSGDPYWANVVLAAHMDGSNGSTSFSDSSSYGRVLSAFGNAQITTSQSVFGGASATFDGTGDYIRTPYTSDLDFGSGDFTVECWIRVTATRTYNGHICGTYTFGSVDGGTQNAGWGLSSSPGMAVSFGWSPGGTWQQLALTPDGVLTLNTWHHIAVSRVGGTIKIFVDGVQKASSAISSNIVCVKSYFYSGSYNRGDADAFSVNISYAGQIDDLRITKGVGRYSSAFTPPIATFPNG